MSELNRPIGEDDLQALVDGRITPERRPAVKEYLARHPEAATRVAAYTSQRQLLRDTFAGRLEQPVPGRLRVENLVDTRGSRYGRWTALAASLATAVIVGGAGGWVARDVSDAAPMLYAQSAVAAHKVFVADRRRPVEIRADAEDQLVQWLSNRMQTTVAIPDLSELGLRFMGGRLLPTSAGPAAQLMYDDDAGSRVTLFIEANIAGVDTESHYSRVQQVEAVTWATADLSYTVAATTGREQLEQVGAQVRLQLSSRSS